MSWSKVILEWVNCLDLLEFPIKNLSELDEKQIFSKIITSISLWKDQQNGRTEKELLLNFINDEYPHIKLQLYDKELFLDNVLITSLLLLRTSQEPIFHKQMCAKLDNETQLKIKMFLEIALSYGNSITKDFLESTISELNDAELINITYPKTPLPTPRGRALKDFFNSPAAQKYYAVSEKACELRKLKAELEMERCEKSDITEDLLIQQEKIKTLQEALLSKEKEIKFLRDELTRPLTPKSCKKTFTIKSDVYKEEIRSLEKYIFNIQKENEKLQDEKEDLAKKLITLESQSAALLEENDYYKKNFEFLSRKVEQTDIDLFDLRKENEELRSNMKELNKLTLNEESFEYDNVNTAHAASFLNASEALSNVIEIQLQEAKDETIKLKNEVASINRHLQSRDLECQKLMDTNKHLYRQIELLKIAEQKLHERELEIEISQKKLNNVSEENATLLKESQVMKEQLRKSNVHELDLTNKFLATENSLKLEVDKNAELESSISGFQFQFEENNKLISNLKDMNAGFESTIKEMNHDAKEKALQLSQLNGEALELKNQIVKEHTEKLNLTDAIKQAKSEILTLTNSNKDIHQQFDLLKIADQKLHEIELEFEVSKTKLNKASEENATLLEESQVMKEQLKGYIESKLNVTNKLLATEDSLKQELDKNAKLESSISGFRFQIEENNELIYNLKNMNAGFECTIKKMDHDAEEKALQLSQLDIRILELNDQIINNDMEKLNLTDTIKQARSEIFTLTQSNKDLHEQIELMKIAEQKLSKVESELQLSYITVEKLSEEILLMKHQSDNHDTNEIILNYKLVDAENSLQREITKSRELESSASKLRIEIEEKNNLIFKLEDLSSGFECTIRKLDVDTVEKDREISRLKDEVFELINRIKMNDAEKLNLTVTINEANSKIHLLKDAFNESVKISQMVEKFTGHLYLLLEEVSKLEIILSENSKLTVPLGSSIDNVNERRILLEQFKNMELTESKSLLFKEELIRKMKFVSLLADEFKYLRKEKIFLKEKLNVIEDKYSQNQNELLDKRKSIETLEESIKKLETDNIALGKTLKEKIQAIESFEVECSNIKEEKLLVERNLNEIIDNIKQELVQQVSIIKVLKGELCTFKYKDDLFQCELNSITQKLVKTLEELNLESFLGDKSVTIVEDKISIIREKEKPVLEEEKVCELNSHKYEVSNSKEESSAKNEIIQILEAKVQNLIIINVSLKNELRFCNEKLINAEVCMTDINKEKVELQTLNSSNQTELNGIQRELIILNSEIMELKKCNSFLSNKLSSTQCKIFRLVDQNKFKNDLIEKLKTVYEWVISESSIKMEEIEANSSKSIEEEKSQLMLNDTILSSNEVCEVLNSNCDVQIYHLEMEPKYEELNNMSIIENELIEKCNKQCKNLEECILKKSLLRDKFLEIKKQNLTLENTMQTSKTREEKLNAYIEKLIAQKEFLYKMLLKATTVREGFHKKLLKFEQNWKTSLNEFYDTFFKHQSDCDELKTLHKEKTILQDIVSTYTQNNLQIITSLASVSVQMFLWTEDKIRSVEKDIDFELENEKQILVYEMEKTEATINEMELAEMRMDSFLVMVNKYKVSPEANHIKNSVENFKKMELQIQNLNKEKRDLKEKLDNIRIRNAKLENNIDEVRSELIMLKSNQTDNFELEKMYLGKVKCFEDESSKSNIEKAHLEEENRCLKAEIDSLKNKIMDKDEQVEVSGLKIDSRIKEIHDEYELKLEKLKEKMKMAYNEQMQKLTLKQEQTIQQKIKLWQEKIKQQCRKHTEEINKYKEHVTELTSRHWEVCDKLLAEKQEKEDAFKQMKEMSLKFNNDIKDLHEKQVLTSLSKTASLDRRDFTMKERFSIDARKGLQSFQIIEEESYSRRRSLQGLQAMGNAFNAEDEEGEIFNNVYLADMKEGRISSTNSDFNRLSVLQMRNSLCKPHLKSSYPAETQFHSLGLTEEDIKNGGTEDVFNDSLSQSLLPNQKGKRKERTQTSYKKPGPPTPSKNGRRLSLQGNEAKSPLSRILKERNTVDKRSNGTPRRLMDIFSHSRQQDENSVGTPRRFSNIFRKKRLPTDKK